MSRNLYERLNSKHLPIMAEADDGAPGGTTGQSSQARPTATDPMPVPIPPALAPVPSVPIGGELTPPADPAPPKPVAPVASEPSTAQVFTEAEVNNRLAQQRAQFDRQIQNLKLQNAAIATGVQGADLLLERIDRKAITYDDAGKPTNL